MKKTTRNLPRLNLCYLQKKAFENHRLKIQKATSSLGIPLQDYKIVRPTATIDKSNIEQTSDRQPSKPRESVSLNKYRKYVSPRQKKTIQAAERQNFRLYRSIQKCTPTIDRRALSQHSVRYQVDTQRLTKFKTDPLSHKKILKCEYSLEKLSGRIQQRPTSQISRPTPISSLSHQKPKPQNDKFNVYLPKTLTDRSKKYPKSSTSNYSPSSNERQKRFKTSVNRNLQKINQHFDKNNVKLKTQQMLQGYRQKSQSAEKRVLTPQIHKWKIRLFPTQPNEMS